MAHHGHRGGGGAVNGGWEGHTAAGARAVEFHAGEFDVALLPQPFPDVLGVGGERGETGDTKVLDGGLEPVDGRLQTVQGCLVGLGGSGVGEPGVECGGVFAPGVVALLQPGRGRRAERLGCESQWWMGLPDVGSDLVWCGVGVKALPGVERGGEFGGVQNTGRVGHGGRRQVHRGQSADSGAGVVDGLPGVAGGGCLVLRAVELVAGRRVPIGVEDPFAADRAVGVAVPVVVFQGAAEEFVGGGVGQVPVGGDLSHPRGGCRQGSRGVVYLGRGGQVRGVGDAAASRDAGIGGLVGAGEDGVDGVQVRPGRCEEFGGGSRAVVVNV